MNYGNSQNMDLHFDRCRPECHAGYLPQKMKEIVTPFVWQEWDAGLANHPDQRFREYIVNGGFTISFDDQRHACRRSGTNMFSATENPQVIRDYLVEECSEGRVLGPLDPACFLDIQTTSLRGNSKR